MRVKDLMRLALYHADSASALARTLGISRMHVYRLRHGRHYPRVDLLLKLCEMAEINPYAVTMSLGTMRLFSSVRTLEKKLDKIQGGVHTCPNDHDTDNDIYQ